VETQTVEVYTCNTY